MNILSTSNNNNNSNSNNGSSTKNNNIVTQGSNKNENIAKNSSLPKTGVSPWLSIGIIVAMIGTIIGYIKYKKIY